MQLRYEPATSGIQTALEGFVKKKTDADLNFYYLYHRIYIIFMGTV